MQQTIAEQVVNYILPGENAVVAEPATRNVNANELMLLARHYDQQVRGQQVVNMDTLREAVRLYRAAIEADPESTLAHSRLASALLYLGDVEAAEAPVFRALSLNPNLSEVQNTLGEFYWARGMPEAKTAFARAVELNPNNADALNNYANSLWYTYEPQYNLFEELTGLYQRALELDPLSLSRHAALGDYLGKSGRAGREEEARAVIRRIEGLFDDAESYRLIGWLKELIGEVDEAIAWALRARDLEPGNPDHLAKLAELYTLIGDYETAQRLEPRPSVGLLFLMRRYQELIDIAEFLMIEEPGDMEVRYLLAFAYNATGQFESAIHVLSTTGLPDSVMNDTARSIAELEAFFTLVNALDGAGQAETTELAHSLAAWNDQGPWWGDIYWVSIYRSCNLAILQRHEKVLQLLLQVKESRRLHWGPLVHDSHCLKQYQQEPAYQDILRDLDERQAALRERLPATLAEFGVKL